MITRFMNHLESEGRGIMVAGVPATLFCDCCKSTFSFATFAIDDQSGRIFNLLTDDQMWRICKFCPICGARNTQPKPEAKP